MSNIHLLGETSQRSGERIAYTDDVALVGSSPTINSVHIYDVVDFAANTDSANFSGSPSVSGSVISTPIVENLIESAVYRIVINFSVDGLTFEDYFTIYCYDEETG